MIADVLTKSLSGKLFRDLRDLMLNIRDDLEIHTMLVYDFLMNDFYDSEFFE